MIYSAKHEDIEIKNWIRYAYAGSYTYQALVEILNSLFLMLDKPKFHAILKKEIEKKQRQKDKDYRLHNCIVNIANYLGFIANNRYK